jgi:hypothetical protein
VQALQEAKATGGLPGRFEVETLPEGGRVRQPVEHADAGKATEKKDDSDQKSPA